MAIIMAIMAIIMDINGNNKGIIMAIMAMIRAIMAMIMAIIAMIMAINGHTNGNDTGHKQWP